MQSSSPTSSSDSPAPSLASTPLATYSTNVAFLLATASKEINAALPTTQDSAVLLPLAAAELVAQQLDGSGVQRSVTAPGYINFTLPATTTHTPSRRKSSSSTPPVPSNTAPILPSRHLTVTQVPATYTEEAFEVFEKYQRAIHNEGTSPSRYTKYATHTRTHTNSHTTAAC